MDSSELSIDSDIIDGVYSVNDSTVEPQYNGHLMKPLPSSILIDMIEYICTSVKQPCLDIIDQECSVGKIFCLLNFRLSLFSPLLPLDHIKLLNLYVEESVSSV